MQSSLVHPAPYLHASRSGGWRYGHMAHQHLAPLRQGDDTRGGCLQVQLEPFRHRRPYLHEAMEVQEWVLGFWLCFLFAGIFL